jgi:hypothetical protein
MVGLAAILFVVRVDKKTCRRLEGDRDVRFSWVFASAGLALLSSLHVLYFHLDWKDMTRTSLYSRGICRENGKLSKSGS